MSLAVNLPSVFVYFHFSATTLPSANVLFFVVSAYVITGSTTTGAGVITVVLTMSLAVNLPSVFVYFHFSLMTLPSLSVLILVE